MNGQKTEEKTCGDEDHRNLIRHHGRRADIIVEKKNEPEQTYEEDNELVTRWRNRKVCELRRLALLSACRRFACFAHPPRGGVICLWAIVRVRCVQFSVVKTYKCVAFARFLAA